MAVAVAVHYTMREVWETQSKSCRLDLYSDSKRNKIGGVQLRQVTVYCVRLRRKARLTL